MIEGVQHRATKIVPGCAKMNYEQRLWKMAQPTMMEYRMMTGCAILANMYLHRILRSTIMKAKIFYHCIQDVV